MKNSEERNILEKITFYSGILVLLVLLGYLSFRIFKNENTPPELSINISEEKSSAAMKFKVEVENKGKRTAEAATINFELYHNGKVSGKAALEINYVPQHSKEIGYIVFPGKKIPADSVVINSITYLQP